MHHMDVNETAKKVDENHKKNPVSNTPQNRSFYGPQPVILLTIRISELDMRVTARENKDEFICNVL